LKHATKYYLKTILAQVVMLVAFFVLAAVGITKANLGMSFLLGFIVFWTVWPSVWNTTKSTKSDIIWYNVFAVLVAAAGFAFQQFAT